MSKTATSSGRHAKFKRMFSFLEEQAYKGETFTLDTLAQVTGYKASSIRTYYGKRLKGALMEEAPGGRYRAKGVGQYDESTFIAYMTQRSTPHDPTPTIPLAGASQDALQPEPVQASQAMIDETTGLKLEFLEHSAQLFHLALEFYHRTAQPGRLHLYCVLALEAWEVLMRAEVVTAVGAEVAMNHAPRGRAQLRQELFPNQQHPVCVNLMWMERLGEAAPHLFVPAFEADLWPLYQACAMNFYKRWQAMAGRAMPGGTRRWQLDPQAPAGQSAPTPWLQDQVETWSGKLARESRQINDARFAILPT